MLFRAKTIDDLEPVATEIRERLLVHPILLLEGEMGTGKTTLIIEICQQLGVKDTVSSPTFSIVNEYLCLDGKVFHFDLYRLKDERELWDTGFEDYIDSGQICLIEWPEMAQPFLSGMTVNYLKIQKEEEDRVISIETIEL